MRVAEAKRMLEQAGGLKGLEEAMGGPLSGHYHDCHNGSLRVARTGLFGTARVARGGCKGVPGQHSWIVIGEPPQGSARPDPYDPNAVIADPTLWSYQGAEPYVYFARNSMKTHVPHSSGSIWACGHPASCPPERAVELAWREPPSKAAEVFLGVLGPLDRSGWAELAHYPVGGWPAGEIIGAIADTLGDAVVPIDVLGMVTERNPHGLYW